MNVINYARKYGIHAAIAMFGFGAVQSAIAAALDTAEASAAMASISDTVPVIGGLFLGVLGLMAAWKLARGLFA